MKLLFTISLLLVNLFLYTNISKAAYFINFPALAINQINEELGQDPSVDEMLSLMERLQSEDIPINKLKLNILLRKCGKIGKSDKKLEKAILAFEKQNALKHHIWDVSISDLATASEMVYAPKGAYFSPSGIRWTQETGKIEIDSGLRIGNYRVPKMVSRAYIYEDKKIIILAFRGSINIYDWIFSDGFTLIFHTGRQKRLFKHNAVDSLNKHIDQFIKKGIDVSEYSFYVTGHSLGGVFAQILAGEEGIKGAAFNAPGLKDWDHRHPGVEFYSHIIDNDVIGRYHMNHHLGKTVEHAHTKIMDTYSIAAEIITTGAGMGSLMSRTTQYILEKFGLKADDSMILNHSIEYFNQEHFNSRCRSKTKCDYQSYPHDPFLDILDHLTGYPMARKDVLVAVEAINAITSGRYEEASCYFLTIPGTALWVRIMS